MKKIIGGFSLVLILFTHSYSQSGQLDPSFGNGGKLTFTEVNNKPIANTFLDINGRMAIQPDGKIILTAITRGNNISQGYDMLIMRLHPDGKADSSFGENGSVVIDYMPDPGIVLGYNNYAKDVAITSQGKIVIAGQIQWFSDGAFESDMIIVQLNADGSRDVSFDGDGIKSFSFGSTSENVEAVAVRPNGNIVVACHILNAFEGKRDVMLAQFKPDGAKDEFFGLAGITGMSLGESESVSTMFLQPDGKIVVGGSIYYPESGKTDYLVARFLAGGRWDDSFSDDAIVTFDMNSVSENITGIAMQSDGKIVVTGRYFPIAYDVFGFAVVRINANGTLDSRFDGDGKKVIPLSGLPEGKSILVDSQDHILIGGGIYNIETGSDFAVLKLTPEGNTDHRFGNEGIAYVDFSGAPDIFSEMEFQSDGKIVLAGLSAPTEGLRYAVAKVLYVPEIGPSNVKATYIGPKILGTPCYGCQTAIIPLRASIQDIAPHLGDIRNARVKFVDRDNNTDITHWIPVTKLISTDTKKATVDATWYVTLSYAQPVKRVRVGMMVDNGSYIRNDVGDDATITLYMPQEDMISGGGELFASGTSMGKYKSGPGSRTLFGFFAQMKPGLPQPSGRMDMWFSETNPSGRNAVYYLTINSIRRLGVDATSFTSGRQAEFHGTGQLWDRSEASPVLLEDNVTVQTHLIDRGEPGAYDFLKIYIWDRNNVLLHSSNWAYTQAMPELLYKGNVTVHIGSSFIESVPELITKSPVAKEKEKVTRKEFNVTVVNNPTYSDFGIKVSGTISNVFSIRVIDISGRVIETRHNLPSGNISRVGSDYKKGMYFAEVRQGEKVSIIKLIKY